MSKRFGKEKTNIEELDLPAAESDCEIRNGVFVRYRGKATEVVIPDSVTTIGGW